MYPNRNKVPQDVLATKGTRFTNYIIDNIVMIAVGFVFGIVLALISEFTESYAIYEALIESEGRLSDYIYGAIITIIYYTIIETLTARSVGKFITKTKVVTHQGLKPDLGDIFIRTLCRLIPFNAFSFLGLEGKGWHDSISKTYVVDVKKFEEMIVTESELDQIGKLQEEN